MHWNWVHTKGEKIICDIQGVKKDDNYELTDPAVYTHKHNEFCKDLPWPNENGIKKIKKLMLITNPTLEKQLYKEVIDSTFSKYPNNSINCGNNFLFYFIFGAIILLSIVIFFCLRKCKNKKIKNHRE